MTESPFAPSRARQSPRAVRPDCQPLEGFDAGRDIVEGRKVREVAAVAGEQDVAKVDQAL